ncbi:MAG TPA: serine/threonine-protein kinase, partial [Terriglobales bacterium]|nr:serine/threonine-protein kinase [Terriglobales bacterium]
MIGRTLGRYLILEQIGAGGMGVVYRAQDDRLGRTVALKVLPAGMLADEAARKRFQKEALALSQLNHPNIATVHDFDTQKDVDFLVMEEIPGITLDRKLETGGALQEKEITRYGMQLAEGLAAAHEKGVVHRDLKPGNLRITPDGRLKILDFGLAKWLQPAHPTDLTRSLSESQQAVGTLPYMAPEQVQGEPADARTDLYAVGTVLYEMATGRRPFPETQGPRLINAILHQAPVAPRALNPRVSPELERIALKCLEKEPENRYQSARDLEVDLRRLGASAPLTTAPPVPARRDGEGAPGGARRAALPVAA